MAHESYFMFWVIFLFGLEASHCFSLLLLGVLVFLEIGYLVVLVLLGKDLALLLGVLVFIEIGYLVVLFLLGKNLAITYIMALL